MARAVSIGSGCFIAAGLVASATVAHAGKLEELRDRTDANDEGSHGSDDSDDDDGCNWLSLLLGGCDNDHDTDDETRSADDSSPQRGTHLLSSNYFFLPYPYAHGNRGNGVELQPPRDSQVSACVANDVTCDTQQENATCVNDECFETPAQSAVLPENQRHLRESRAQLFADVGQDTQGLRRGTLGASFDSNRTLGLDTRWTYWIEHLPNEQLDSLWLGDVNLRLGAVNLPAFQLAFGLGARVLTGGGSQVGANVGANAEFYPIAPLVLRGEFDAGNLGPAMFWEGQGTLGVAINRYELYAGAAHFQVQDVSFDSAFAGLRVHF